MPKADPVVTAPGTITAANDSGPAAGVHVMKLANAQRRLLVVDDDASIREIAFELLGAEGYQVMTADDGVDALRLIAAVAPDLVITDLKMPNMSGAELMSAVRARWPKIPIIAVSGDVTRESLPPGLSADAIFPKGAFVTRPFLDAIAALLANRPPRDAGEDKSAAHAVVANKHATSARAATRYATTVSGPSDDEITTITGSEGFHGVADMRAVFGRLAQAIQGDESRAPSPAPEMNKAGPRGERSLGERSTGAERGSAFGTSCD